MTREETIIVALCRCAMAGEPTEATKHQILRLRRYYEFSEDRQEICAQISDILKVKDSSEPYFRVIKSKKTNDNE